MWKLGWNHQLIMMFLGCMVLSRTTIASSCPSTHFQCANGRCVSIAWLCDGEDDCHDKSDEANCTSTTCGTTDFRCETDGACVPQRWTCDKDPDCKDESDEDPKHCKSKPCEDGKFQCGSLCLQQSWVCDGEEDCEQGEDEQNCGEKTCKPDTEFQCKTNQQCISSRWRCDRNKDCGDGSDEEDCPESHYACEEYEFECSDKQCIQKTWVCDGDNDCNDKSDEANCQDREETCRKSEFQCKTLDRMCIHMSWKCDGDADCEDQSDEKNCNITCRADQFLCEDNYCVHESLKCDGQMDCMSGSDEADCPPTHPTCSNNTFDCHGDGSKCIPYHLVCDSWNDCGNYEDEWTENHDPCPEENPCKVNNGGCQHICYRSPDGAICACHSGFELAAGSKTECVDINECLLPGTCSQTCFNTKGSFKCECLPGYELLHHHTCKALEGEPELLLADRKDLRRYNLYTKKYTLLIDDKQVEGAVALDFHFKKNTVFWTDVTKEQIMKVDLSTGVVATVVGENVSTPDGLAVDWVHGNIYWTDTGLDTIEVASLDGALRRVLVKDRLEEPRAIVVHPGKGLMFWTDWGVEPKIESCGMDGKNRQTVIGERIVWPNGLTIDYVDDRLYWIDAKTHVISSSDLDGNNRRQILRGHQHLGHSFAITVFEDYLYWSDWPSESICRYNKFQKGQVETIAQGLDSPMDIHIFHSYRQSSSYENRCGDNNGGCEQLCLPNSEQTYSCECKNGYMQDPEDSTKCVEEKHTAAPAPVTPKVTTSAPGTQTPHPNSLTKKPVVTTTKTTTTTTTTTTPASPTSVTSTESLPVNKEADEGLGHVAIIVIAVVLLIGLLVIAVGILVFRRYRNRNIKSMNFDNPVYRKTTTEDEKVYMDKTGSRQHLPSSMQPLNTDGELA
ncbi:low-density lipoprotein receptor-like [Babylonia areolata]|uniref:low-density lipoprotein receptor-like n=1 Tax=Babylonia areolata TaxID=304850 RepID=UPI003FD1DDB6